MAGAGTCMHLSVLDLCEARVTALHGRPSAIDRSDLLAGSNDHSRFEGMMCDFEDPAAAKSRGAVLFDDHGELPTSKDMPLSIANVAKMFRLSQLTLRYYERLGLIRRRNRIGQNLVYGWIDCDRLAFIIKARRAGLAIRQIAPLIKGTEETATAQFIVDARAKCLELIDQLDRRRHDLREALAELRHLDKLLSRTGHHQDDGVPPDDEGTQTPA
jgi:DNA-binding transcriptional MerR regulator